MAWTRCLIAALALAAFALTGCGGSSASSIVPEAQAAVVDSCPAGDATGQLQGALDAGREVVLPACTFTVTSLRVSKPTRIRCASADTDGTVIRFSGNEGLVVDPGVVVNIATGGWNKRGYWFEMTNCRIEPTVKGGGKHPFVMRVRPGFFISTSYVGHNHFGGAGAQGIYLDNTAGNVDGIFTTTFDHNFIENGVLGVNIGDSVHFIDNIVPDGAQKLGLPGYDLSWVDGAAESAIVRGNITTAAGCIVVRKGQGLKLDHVWCESAGTPAGEQGVITLKNCLECTIFETRIQAFGQAPYALASDGSAVLNVLSNKLNKGAQGHALFTNSREPSLLLNRFDGGRSGVVVGLLP